MCVIYLLNNGTAVKKDHQRIVLENQGEKIGSMPIMDVESIVVGKGANISTPIIEECLKKGISITFVDFHGRVTGHMDSSKTSWKKLKKQIDIFTSSESQLVLAKALIKKKIANQQKQLRYYARQNESVQLGLHAEELKEISRKVDSVVSIEALMGVEGTAAKIYFDAFSEILPAGQWRWHGRSRRPAEDAVNALLNYGYAFLERDVRIAVAGTNLDERIGFYHSNNDRKDSLIFDLMEQFRQPIIDKLILSMIKRRQISTADFVEDISKKIFITAKGKKIWVICYEAFMERAHSEFCGLSPRKALRKEITAFARGLYKDIQVEENTMGEGEVA